MRIEPIIEQGRQSNHGPEICPCEDKNYNTCSFLRQYRENLEKIKVLKRALLTDKVREFINGKYDWAVVAAF